MLTIHMQPPNVHDHQTILRQTNSKLLFLFLISFELHVHFITVARFRGRRYFGAGCRLEARCVQDRVLSDELDKPGLGGETSEGFAEESKGVFLIKYEIYE